MSLKVGDLVEYRLTGAVGVAVNKNVVVTSLDSFVGWVEVFDGSKTVAVPLYSLHPVGD
jgi:hypothetical protein